MTQNHGTDELDAVWRKLVDEGDDTAKSLDAKLQKASEEYELCLAELRDLARFRIHNPDLLTCGTCGSTDRVKKHPSKDSNICWTCYTGFES